jgi:hypothetical protein
MADSSLNEFNRLLYGRNNSEAELEYERLRKQEEEELWLDYSKMFDEEKNKEAERIVKLEKELSQLTQKFTEQEEKMEQLKSLVEKKEAELVGTKGCWSFCCGKRS